MVNRNLIREFDVTDEEEQAAIGLASPDELEMDWLGGDDVTANQIVEGKVLRIDEEFVLVDVGYKSEGIIPATNGKKGTNCPRSARRSACSSKTSKTSPATKTIAA
jgi:hypothetical protein